MEVKLSETLFILTANGDSYCGNRGPPQKQFLLVPHKPELDTEYACQLSPSLQSDHGLEQHTRHHSYFLIQGKVHRK